MVREVIKSTVKFNFAETIVLMFASATLLENAGADRCLEFSDNESALYFGPDYGCVIKFETREGSCSMKIRIAKTYSDYEYLLPPGVSTKDGYSFGFSGEAGNVTGVIYCKHSECIKQLLKVDLFGDEDFRECFQSSLSSYLNKYFPGNDKPTTSKQEPTTGSQVPTTESEVPVTEAKGSITEPEGPVTETEGAVTEPEGPVTEPKGPVTEPEGSVTESEEPITESTTSFYYTEISIPGRSRKGKTKGSTKVTKKKRKTTTTKPGATSTTSETGDILETWMFVGSFQDEPGILYYVVSGLLAAFLGVQTWFYCYLTHVKKEYVLLLRSALEDGDVEENTTTSVGTTSTTRTSTEKTGA